MQPSTSQNTSNLTVEVQGGPQTQHAWKKWHKDGVIQLVKALEIKLIMLGYDGEFRIKGVESKVGKFGMIRFEQIIAERNAIGFTAQLASPQSRWKYELFPPPNVDVVELFNKIQSITYSEIESLIDAKPYESEKVVVKLEPVRKQRAVAEIVEPVEVMPTEATTPTETKLQQLHSLAAEYQDAEKSVAEHTPDLEATKKKYAKKEAQVDELMKELAELRGEIDLYEEEMAPAMNILNSKKHQDAKEKIRLITEILGD